jgi:hypothetical protein
MGAFRFCRTCRLDFDAIAVGAGPAAGEPATHPAPPLTPATNSAAWMIAAGVRYTTPRLPTTARYAGYRLPDGW